MILIWSCPGNMPKIYMEKTTLLYQYHLTLDLFIYLFLFLQMNFYVFVFFAVNIDNFAFFAVCIYIICFSYLLNGHYSMFVHVS